MDTARLLEDYDREMRADPAPEAGLRYERDGSIVRAIADEGECCILYSDLGDEAADADAAIRAQAAFCRARGLALEWKLYDHDRPRDLAARLAAAGFTPDEPEVLMGVTLDRLLAASDPLSAADANDGRDAAPDGYHIARVTDADGLARFAQASGEAFARDEAARVEAFRARLADPSLALYVAFDDARPVAAARLEMPPGRTFAGLWGGGVVPGDRGRGLYRALVFARAVEARARGYRALTVDARSTSLPILARLGFAPLASVRGWLLSPDVSAA